MRLLRRIDHRDAQSGFVMPTVIILIVIMSFVAFAALIQANNGLNLAYKQAYIQMARTASKAAIDYAQEQFDNAPCGSYDGTSEQTLVSNNRYRVTFKSEVIGTSADGFEKTIKGTGSVYLPLLSTTAQYVFDIRSEIIRTYATCKSPDDFNPVLWLDASDTSTLKTASTPTTVHSAQIGISLLDLFLPNDSVEEKVTNGQQGAYSWLSSDLDMHTCGTDEFPGDCSGSKANRDLYVGLVFQNLNIPKNVTITSASLQLSGSSPSGSGGSVTHRIYGLYQSATNPHLDLFSPGSSNQVRSRITSSSLRTTALTDQSFNNFPPGNTVNFDVTSIVQEMVNNANWDPGDNGGRLGLGIERLAGSGSRSACKGNISLFNIGCIGKGPRLSITYSTSAVSQADNGDTVSEWLDKSGLENHARSVYGNGPVRVDNQINGKTIVRFTNDSMLSSLQTALSNKRDMTVIAVTKANFSTSATDGRFLSGMTSTSTNDTTAGTSIIPLLRYVGNSGFSNQYSGSNSAYRTNYSCGATCSSLAYLYTSLFNTNSSNTTDSTLKGNGAEVANHSGISPSGTPYTYGIDQLYIGGRRDGAMPGIGADFMNGDYAELVVYDKALECRQIEALEDYFRTKWNLSATAYTPACPSNTIPTL